MRMSIIFVSFVLVFLFGAILLVIYRDYCATPKEISRTGVLAEPSEQEGGLIEMNNKGENGVEDRDKQEF